MELFIRITNGQPVDHPILGNNFRQAFPDIDTNNLPIEFARFNRIEAPGLSPYEKNQTVSYQLVNGTWTDVFACEQMTAEEITTKQQAIKDEWAQNGFASWAFNEATCTFDPPTPYPNDGKRHTWDEPTLTWIELP
jgi:hypothetical protein